LRLGVIMRIRNCALTLLLGLAAGGCNWSNQDIEFLYALPTSDALGARSPDQAGSTQQGLGQQSAGLSVAEPSAMFQRTVGAARSFNSMLFAILDALERVRQLPPTRREANRRIWGPIADRQDPDREVRLVIERNRQPDDSFVYGWHIEMRRVGEPESAWIAAVEGSYVPSADIRKGSGSLRHDAARLRAAGFERADADPNLLSVDIGYDTGIDPLFVAMHLAFTAGTLDSEFEEFADGTARLVFDVRADFVPGPSAAPETARFTSRWIGSGAGRTDVVALAGGDVAVLTDIGEECWDETFDTVYFREVYDLDGNGTVDGTGGDASACAL
jgi:hypothetical protein